MTMSSVIRLAAAMFGVIALTATAAKSAPSAARGKQTFMRVGCYTCHGTEGQGSGSGTKLAPDPLPAEALAQFLRNAAGFMPSYGETNPPQLRSRRHRGLLANHQAVAVARSHTDSERSEVAAVRRGGNVFCSAHGTERNCHVETTY